MRIYVYIPKCYLCGVYNVPSMSVLRADYLELDSQLVCSSLGHPQLSAGTY